MDNLRWTLNLSDTGGIKPAATYLPSFARKLYIPQACCTSAISDLMLYLCNISFISRILLYSHLVSRPKTRTSKTGYKTVNKDKVSSFMSFAEPTFQEKTVPFKTAMGPNNNDASFKVNPI